MKSFQRFRRISTFALFAILFVWMGAALRCWAQGSDLATITVNAPAAAVQNQPVTFAVTITGQAEPTPTGTVSLLDNTTNTSYGPFTLAPGNPATGVASFTITFSATGDHSYLVNYAGDGNYSPETVQGSIFIQAGLVSIAPAAIPAGPAPNTPTPPNATITLTGQDFTNASIVEFVSGGAPVPLTTTYISATKLQALIPLTVQFMSTGGGNISVNTAGVVTNAIPLRIYNQFAPTITASATPVTLTYGQTGPLTLGSNVSRSATTQGAVPSGSITFSVGGTPFGTPALLAQNTAAAGNYLVGTASTVDSQSQKLLSADFNNDGLADALGFGSYSSDYLQLLLSAGPDSFQTEYEIYAGCVVVDFAVIDLNKDGNQDIVVTCQTPDAPTPIGTYILGNGDGSFQAPVTFATSENSAITSPGYIVAGDFNGDGAADIALLDYAGNLQVFLGNQPFTTLTPQTVTTYPATVSSPLNVVAADFNQDGKSDLAILEYVYYPSSTGAVIVLTSNGDGTFTTQQQAFTSQTVDFDGQLLAVTDLTGSGYPSVVVPDPQGDPGNGAGQLIVYQNNGAGTLNAAVDYPAPNVVSVTGIPFPSIGKPASAIQPGYTMFYSTVDTDNSAAISVQPLSSAMVNGQLTFTPGPAITNVGFADYCDCSTYFAPMVAADFNGDGYLDLLLSATVAIDSNISQDIPLFFSDDAITSEIATLPSLNAGTYSLTAGYPGDINFASETSAATTITVSQALPGVAASGPPVASTGQSVTLTATVTGVAGGTIPSGTVQFYYDSANALGGPQALTPGTASSTASISTSVIPAGVHTITTTYSGDVNYLGNAASYQITVNAASDITLASVTPATGYLGASATAVTLTGTGFTANSIVQLNGATIAGAFTSATQMQATIPASFFTKIQNGTITVTDPANGVPSNGLVFSVTAPPVQVVLSGPPTAPPATQPTINFQLPTAYPLPITGTFTLTVQPTTAGGLVDPAVQFASGGDTFTFTLPANTTTTPTVQLQTGTLSGAITVTLTLQADGTDITPASLQPVVVQVPAAAPTITSMSLLRSGLTLTVSIQGFSNTRDMRSGNFIFTAASGATINNPNVTVDLTSAYVNWYVQPTSDQYGSAFTYIQTFLLSDDASTVASVSATLVNSVGTSNSKSAQ